MVPANNVAMNDWERMVKPQGEFAADRRNACANEGLKWATTEQGTVWDETTTMERSDWEQTSIRAGPLDGGHVPRGEYTKRVSEALVRVL